MMPCMKRWMRRMISIRRKFAHQVLCNQVKKPRKDDLCKKERDLSTSHMDVNLTFSMFINYAHSLTILFHFISLNKIDILIDEIDQIVTRI